MIINIAVCTCLRNRLLKQALNSFLNIQVPSGAKLIVSVVDNDVQQSAKVLVTAFQNQAPFEVQYINEQKRGIPYARNAAIGASLKNKADFLIFLDDDECVSDRWLIELVRAHKQYGERSVVCGRVISRFPDSAADYYKPFFCQNLGKTGRRLKVCATNNVLIPKIAFCDFELQFDESNPLVGGTDSLFFNEAVKRGLEIYYCAEAVVYEEIPESRLSINWLCRRKYRAGITMSQIDRSNGKAELGIFLSSSLKMIQYSLVSLIMFALNKKDRALNGFLKVMRAAGKISGLFGAKVDSYKVLDNVD